MIVQLCKDSAQQNGRHAKQQKLIHLMKNITLIQSRRYVKMSGQDRLRIELKHEELKPRVLAVVNFMKELA